MAENEILKAVATSITKASPKAVLFTVAGLCVLYFGVTCYCNHNASKYGLQFENKPLGIKTGPVPPIDYIPPAQANQIIVDENREGEQ